MTRLRIAYLLTQDSGGPVDVTVRLARALLATGEADVRVFGPVPRRGAEAVAGYHEHVEVGDKADVRAGRRARTALRAWEPDVVHAQDRRAGLVVSALRLRHKVIQTYHGVPDDVGEAWFRGVPGAARPSAYTRTVLAADAMVARAVHRTVVPAREMGRFLATRLRVPSNRVTHIDNCVEPAHVHLPVGPVRRLVFVGLLVDRKGLATLLAALARPGVMPADATLTVVGDGPERARVEELARALGGRVTFLGFRADVPDLLRHHDALVLPSTMEQQPLVVAEAMAAGKPVVATDTGGVADMLGYPGNGAALAAPGDIDQLAARLRELFADPDPALIGKRLAERAQERFAPDVCARHHLTLYRELTGRGPAV
ncbi:glycosyltransferase involved in cell wall biosynthesis [Saccharothrix ecbatanensis]|uniref:Glycosyltransferase involved in cell wall biosynthesis n=1 Tax=Saccharothrix ecbatanensis TaxID=1105145 RepID=A0A7W9HG54_9PSEU|nr:glycosyltransferase family 4 protein [Saccharothrix ecbatanensis]MBB5801620.1 glycosyltransferase involved in cell wall biosynthesis [Saccharothrix ecbatanensis]